MRDTPKTDESFSLLRLKRVVFDLASEKPGLLSDNFHYYLSFGPIFRSNQLLHTMHHAPRRLSRRRRLSKQVRNITQIEIGMLPVRIVSATFLGNINIQ